MVRVILLCRDRNDNVLFSMEVKSELDTRIAYRECMKYGKDTWIDYEIIT